jgi:glycosyltransferase involved in cell wall biosynthesis
VKLIFDARALRMYPVGKPGFKGGTETMVERIAGGLADHGHTVHVVTPDLEQEEQRGPTEWWWGPTAHPTQADAVVMVHSLAFIEPYHADHLIFATNGVDPELGPEHEMAAGIDRFPVFSETHGRLLRQLRPTVTEAQCVVTGLGIDHLDYFVRMVDGGIFPASYVERVPGRLLFSNDPARGLWHALDVFDHLKRLVPDATLHVAYDFERQFEHHRWVANSLAEALWDCRKRLQTTPGVTSLGALSREELVAEQLACDVHAYASDPPNVGSQIHGLTQMECAAAGAALVLSETEAFPEVFGEAALILPIPGTYRPELARRFDAQDWADNIAAILGDALRLAAMREASRALAARNSWAHVVDRWDAMLAGLGGDG